MPANQNHPINDLFNAIKTVEPYPTGVIPIPKMLSGTAFFPGGSGLWLGDSGSWYTLSDRPDMPTEKVMILGHNFDNEKGYKDTESVKGQHELESHTWWNLRSLLQSVDIRVEDCFFTNAYMGLSTQEDSNEGEFPGATDLEFKQRCQSFLAKQIAVQQPRLILTLGRFVPNFIAPLSPNLAAWEGCEKLTLLDDLGPLKSSVHFNDSMEHPVTIVALTHPCRRKGSLKRWPRYYCGEKGEAAELAMLRKALKLSGLQQL